MIDDDLYSPSLAKKLKRKIDHRLATIEDAANEMRDLVPDSNVANGSTTGILIEARTAAADLKTLIDERTRKPKS